MEQKFIVTKSQLQKLVQKSNRVRKDDLQDLEDEFTNEATMIVDKACKSVTTLSKSSKYAPLKFSEKDLAEIIFGNRNMKYFF